MKQFEEEYQMRGRTVRGKANEIGFRRRPERCRFQRDCVKYAVDPLLDIALVSARP